MLNNYRKKIDSKLNERRIYFAKTLYKICIGNCSKTRTIMQNTKVALEFVPKG